MMSTHYYYLFFTLFLSGSFAQFDPNFSNQQNVIVQLFEWTWKDIAKECETFLQFHGYGGVQISPPNENLIISKRPWYERYQPVSYVLKTRSGDEEDFKNMTRRCNNVGVRIYADVVINHMSAGNGVGTGGNSANNGYYPSVPYGPGDFHDTCAIDNYNDLNNVRNCQLVGLRDLNHQKDHVRDKIVEYMNHLIVLGVAGFRVDAAKHMWPEDLKQILLRIKDLNTEFGFKPHTRPFIYQEVIDAGTEPTKSSDYKHIGAVMEFKFSKKISNMFKGNDKLTYLSNWGTSWGFLDSDVAVVFVDNHDLQREDNHLHYKDSKKYKMANAFMLAHPYGTAKVMSSFHFNNHGQGPPQDTNENLLSPKINPDNTCGNGYVCEHRWRQIYNMAKFRNMVRYAPLTNWWSNGDQQISFCRGNKGFIAFTQWLDLKTELQTCLPPGQYCDIISGNLVDKKCTGKIINVKEDGKASITILSSDEDGVVAILENIKLD